MANEASGGKNPIEAYELQNGAARFYFSHSDEKFTTGVLVLLPGASIPRHNRPLAVENLVQIYGKCLMTLFEDNGAEKNVELDVGEGVSMPKAQWHIHSNPPRRGTRDSFQGRRKHS